MEEESGCFDSVGRVSGSHELSAKGKHAGECEGEGLEEEEVEKEALALPAVVLTFCLRLPPFAMDFEDDDDIRG